VVQARAAAEAKLVELAELADGAEGARRRDFLHVRLGRSQLEVQLLKADRLRVVERVVDDQMVGGFGLYKLAAFAFLTDNDLVPDSERFDGRVLLGEAGFAKLFAKLERGAVECRDFVVSLDEEVGDAKRVERGQQMLDRADRAAAAGEGGVVAGVGDVLEAD